MTTGRDNLTKAETVSIAAIETSVPAAAIFDAERYDEAVSRRRGRLPVL